MNKNASLANVFDKTPILEQTTALIWILESGMKISGDMLLDKRLVHRHIEQGIVSRDEYDNHINSLADLKEIAVELNAELLDVGVKDVEAKDTGENE